MTRKFAIVTKRKLGPKQSEAARIMWKKLSAGGFSKAELADVLGVPRGHLSGILWCDRKPGLELAFAIEDKLDIRARLWVTAPRRPIVVGRVT